MSVEILFSCVCLHLRFSNFWQLGLKISDFCLLVNGFDQDH